MAIQRHEQTTTYVEYHFDGIGFQEWAFGADLDAKRRSAARHLADGNGPVALVTIRETWRGRNGKRTREEISREPITA